MLHPQATYAGRGRNGDRSGGEQTQAGHKRNFFTSRERYRQSGKGVRGRWSGKWGVLGGRGSVCAPSMTCCLSACVRVAGGRGEMGRVFQASVREPMGAPNVKSKGPADDAASLLAPVWGVWTGRRSWRGPEPTRAMRHHVGWARAIDGGGLLTRWCRIACCGHGRPSSTWEGEQCLRRGSA